MKKLFLYAVCLPNDIAMVLSLLVVRLLWGSSFLIKNGGLWVVLKENSKFWDEWTLSYSGVCLGHGGIFASPVKIISVVHEAVHLEQFEVSMLKSFLSASVAFIVCAILCPYKIALMIFLCVWPFGYLFYLISGWLVAFLRGESPYKGSSHEEAAYAIAEDYLRRKEGADAPRRILK